MLLQRDELVIHQYVEKAVGGIFQELYPLLWKNAQLAKPYTALYYICHSTAINLEFNSM